MKSLVIIAVLLLSGCASTRSPDNEIVIRELGATAKGWQALFVGGAVLGGGRISQIGTVEGCVEYVGKRLTYRSPACSLDTMP